MQGNIPNVYRATTYIVIFQQMSTHYSDCQNPVPFQKREPGLQNYEFQTRDSDNDNRYDGLTMDSILLISGIRVFAVFAVMVIPPRFITAF